MLRPEQELTEWQRQEIANRIISDAELIKRGATISAAGTLVLGECQAEYMGLHNAFPYFDPDIINEEPPEPGPKEEWLDTPVNVALRPRYSSSRDIPQPLRKMGVPIRDILVLGRGYISETPYIGKKTIDTIDSLVAENVFGLEWKDNPTPEDAAHICQRLGQVTANVLRLDVSFYGLGGKPSVLGIVRMPTETRHEIWREGQIGRSYAYFGDHIKDRLFNYPEVFALRFERERWAIDYSG